MKNLKRGLDIYQGLEIFTSALMKEVICMASITQLESMLLFEQYAYQNAEEHKNRCKEYLLKCSEDKDVEGWFDRYMIARGYALNFENRVTELQKIIKELKENGAE